MKTSSERFSVRTAVRFVAAVGISATVGQFHLYAAAAQTPLVETIPERRGVHVTTPVDYGTPFPTSGPHNPRPAPPDFYDWEVPPVFLVHSLEHGNIVIYYDQPGDAALKIFRSWSQRFQDPWAGIVATRRSGLGQRVVLTAWTKRLELERFDADAGFAFVDAFRGRGPENRVR